MRLPTNRAPTHPGEMLRYEFLEPLGLTQQNLADAIDVSYQRINELVNGKRGITPSTALRLSKFFGNSVEFWMNLQAALDIYETQQREAQTLRKIRAIDHIRTAA